MAIRQLRRLGPAAGLSLHERMQANALHAVYWKRWTDALEREHPELIIEREGNVLAADGHGGAKLLYSFENERAFADHFASMFDMLLPRLRRTLGDGDLRVRLSYFPARPAVEPVLRRLSFIPARDWLEFNLPKTVKLASAAAPRGVRFREGGAADVAELVRIDREAFPDTPMPIEGMRARIEDGVQVLVAMGGKSAVGYCLYSQPDPGEGFIHVLATADGHRGKGIGAGLTLRAVKRLFAEGARQVRLTTDQDNRDAIRLYASLGFKQTRAGRDYTRPTDPREVERRREERQGILIRFGGWR